MRTYRLLRLEDDGEACRGVLVLGPRFVAQTLERPWKGNQRLVSCIPAGVYKATWRRSPKFGFCYEIDGVPARSDILIHAGNSASDTEGCILFGQVVSTFGDTPGIGRSRAAIEQFHREQAPEPFVLRIENLTLEA